MKKTMVCTVAALAGIAVLGSAGMAQAAPTPIDCSTLPNPVVLYGSTAVKPVVKTLATTLTNPQVSIIYGSVSSCVGLSDVTTGTADQTAPLYLAADGTTETPCTVPTTGFKVDVGISDVYPATCGNITVGSNQKEFLGPVQVMTFDVPKASTETSISADAGYTVFGFAGQTYQVTPWIDPTQMFIRVPTSGTINMLGTAIGLPAAKWLVGSQYDKQRNQGSGGVLSGLQSATNANAAIGILAADFADAHRDTIKILAYQHTNQECGYLPDSDATHFDKINVRQGRYAIWGPVHMITNVDASGKPTNANAATLLSFFTGSGITTAQTKAMITAEAAAYTIPLCAMQVSRTAEIGAEASYQDPQPCGCFYESLKNGGSVFSSYCKACTADADCADAGTYTHCRYGFCEAQ